VEAAASSQIGTKNPDITSLFTDKSNPRKPHKDQEFCKKPKKSSEFTGFSGLAACDIGKQ